MNDHQELKKSSSHPQIAKATATPTHRDADGLSLPREKRTKSPTHRQEGADASNLLSNVSLYPPLQEESGPDQTELEKKARREKFLKDYPAAATMLKNIKIGESDTKSLKTLKDEFMKSGFIYSMTPTSPDKFLNGTKDGDCSTLAKTYVKIAKEYLGIENVKIGSKLGDFFVPNGGKVLDQNQATGNVDNGKHWVFTNHYWVESPIGNIDLLFLGQELDTSKWIDKTGEGDDDGIGYRAFGDYKVYDSNYMAATLADKYATSLGEAKEGKEKAEKAVAEMAAPVRPNRRPNLLSRLFGSG
jgi:hypothetical protein